MNIDESQKGTTSDRNREVENRGARVVNGINKDSSSCEKLRPKE